MEDRILSIIGLCFGIIGIILAILFYLKGKKEKKIGAIIKTSRIISRPNHLPEFEMRYKGKKVEKLVMTRIAIFSIGNLTIEKKDVPEKAPIRLILPAILYDYKISFVKSDANEFELLQDKNDQLILNFDYIDYGDGCIIQLLHGEILEKPFSLKCNLKGTSFRLFFNENDPLFKYFRQILWFIFLITVLVSSTKIKEMCKDYLPNNFPVFIEIVAPAIIMTLISAVIMLSTGFILIKIKRRKIPEYYLNIMQE